MTKYDLSKSSLIDFTSPARSTAPDPSLASSRAVSGASTLDGGLKNEVAMPKNSEAYQATLSTTFAFSGWDSVLDVDFLVGFSPLQRNLQTL